MWYEGENMKMMKVFMMVTAMAVGMSWADAGPSANRTKGSSGLLDRLLSDDEASAPQVQMKSSQGSHSRAERAEAKRFDGVWVDQSDQILLIKRVKGTLYLSGSSENSAWQAKCLLEDVTATCVGSGISQTEGGFNYEGELRKQGVSLQASWKLEYRSGQSASGLSSCKKEL